MRTRTNLIFMSQPRTPWSKLKKRVRSIYLSMIFQNLPTALDKAPPQYNILKAVHPKSERNLLRQSNILRGVRRRNERNRIPLFFSLILKSPLSNQSRAKT